jgi:hypothetical protein
VPEASSNQFEESLKSLGLMLGFSAERPEQVYSNGPDVLWLLNKELGLVIEAKSRKKLKNAFTREQHGQLLVATQWFQKEYAGLSYIPVSVQASNQATPKAVAENSRVLTYGKLNELIADARNLFTQLVEMVVPGEELGERCEHLLVSTKLRPKDIVTHYLLSFSVDKHS